MICRNGYFSLLWQSQAVWDFILVKRLTQTDWLELGLKALASKGDGAIRIDTLCAIAKRTKGSFYHHFQTREVFVDALLAHWTQKLTNSIIDETEKAITPVAKLMALSALTTDFDGGAERELRRWAGHDKAVKAAIEAVDQRRVKYVAKLLKQAKDIPARQAMDLAVMNYAALIGYQQMFKPVPADRRKRIDQVFVEILQQLPDY